MVYMDNDVNDHALSNVHKEITMHGEAALCVYYSNRKQYHIYNIYIKCTYLFIVNMKILMSIH